MFSSLIYFYLFFLYISLEAFFGQGIAPASQRGVKKYNQNMESDIYGNTALPFKHSNPTNLNINITPT